MLNTKTSFVLLLTMAFTCQAMSKLQIQDTPQRVVESTPHVTVIIQAKPSTLKSLKQYATAPKGYKKASAPKAPISQVDLRRTLKVLNRVKNTKVLKTLMPKFVALAQVKEKTANKWFWKKKKNGQEVKSGNLNKPEKKRRWWQRKKKNKIHIPKTKEDLAKDIKNLNGGNKGGRCTGPNCPGRGRNRNCKGTERATFLKNWKACHNQASADKKSGSKSFTYNGRSGLTWKGKRNLCLVAVNRSSKNCHKHIPGSRARKRQLKKRRRRRRRRERRKNCKGNLKQQFHHAWMQCHQAARANKMNKRPNWGRIRDNCLKTVNKKYPACAKRIRKRRRRRRGRGYANGITTTASGLGGRRTWGGRRRRRSRSHGGRRRRRRRRRRSHGGYNPHNYQRSRNMLRRYSHSPSRVRSRNFLAETDSEVVRLHPVVSQQ